MKSIVVKTKKTFKDVTDKERETSEIKSFFICINNRIIDTDKRAKLKKVFKEILLNNEISLEKLLDTDIKIFLYTLWFYHSETIKIKDLFTLTIK